MNWFHRSRTAQSQAITHSSELRHEKTWGLFTLQPGCPGVLHIAEAGERPATQPTSVADSDLCMLVLLQRARNTATQNTSALHKHTSVLCAILGFPAARSGTLPSPPPRWAPSVQVRGMFVQKVNPLTGEADWVLVNDPGECLGGGVALGPIQQAICPVADRLRLLDLGGN